MPQKKVKKSKMAHIEFHVDKEKLFKRYVNYLSNPWSIMWRNFLVGTFQGLGFALGTAALLTLLGFVFGDALADLPFLKQFAEFIDTILETSQEIKK